nr:unknown [Pieris rapae granulovirus]
MDIIFDYEEQVEWNKLQDLHIYIKNNLDIDDVIKNLIDTIIKGLTEMINKENKKEILKNIGQLLQNTKDSYEREQQKKFVKTSICTKPN